MNSPRTGCSCDRLAGLSWFFGIPLNDCFRLQCNLWSRYRCFEMSSAGRMPASNSVGTPLAGLDDTLGIVRSIAADAGSIPGTLDIPELAGVYCTMNRCSVPNSLADIRFENCDYSSGFADMPDAFYHTDCW